jgi:hypothetical protein
MQISKTPRYFLENRGLAPLDLVAPSYVSGTARAHTRPVVVPLGTHGIPKEPRRDGT